MIELIGDGFVPLNLNGETERTFLGKAASVVEVVGSLIVSNLTGSLLILYFVEGSLQPRFLILTPDLSVVVVDCSLMTSSLLTVCDD